MRHNILAASGKLTPVTSTMREMSSSTMFYPNPPACAFCGAPAEARCDHGETAKRLAILAAELAPSDTVALRPSARRVWKVLNVWPLGPDPAFAVLVDIECRAKRMQRAIRGERAITVVRVGTCGAPVCELHARDLGGRHLCAGHW